MENLPTPPLGYLVLGYKYMKHSFTYRHSLHIFLLTEFVNNLYKLFISSQIFSIFTYLIIICFCCCKMSPLFHSTSWYFANDFFRILCFVHWAFSSYLTLNLLESSFSRFDLLSNSLVDIFVGYTNSIKIRILYFD